MMAVLKIGDFVDFVESTTPADVPLPQRWYLLRLQPHREGKVTRAFNRRGVSYYLPMVLREVLVTKRDGREVKTRRTEPLFPGLLFVPDFEVSRTRLRDVEGVIGLFHMGECTPFLTPKLMADVRAIAASSNVPASKLERLFEIGALVRVVDGPFSGFQGRIERLDSKGRLRVLLDAFKREQLVEMDDCSIEPVSPDNGRRTARQTRVKTPRWRNPS